MRPYRCGDPKPLGAVRLDCLRTLRAAAYHRQVRWQQQVEDLQRACIDLNADILRRLNEQAAEQLGLKRPPPAEPEPVVQPHVPRTPSPSGVVAQQFEFASALADALGMAPAVDLQWPRADPTKH